MSRVQRLHWVRAISIALLAVGSAACSEAPNFIQLGPLPERPAPLGADDGGVDLPDGAVPCREATDCDDGVDCTTDECLNEGYCRSRSDYSRCSDGVFCNGIEICDPTQGCLSGFVPTCDDQNPCTIDHCDNAQKGCVHASRDFDHDGEADVHCPGGTDCDDFDETRGSRVAELCGDLVDNDCDDIVDENVCGKPAHDTCDDALDIGSGGLFEVSLLGAVGDYSLSCATATETRDVVFTFELTEPRDVKLEASGILADGKDEITSLALQTRCGVRSLELQCAHGFPSDLRVRALPAGRYYVVATSSSSAGSLWLSASTSPPTTGPTNTTCASAIDVGQGGRFEGDFVDVGDDTLSSCGVPGQPDVFYTFTLTEPHDVEILALSEEPGNLTISVRNGCEEPSTMPSCRSSQPAFTRLHELAAGHYVIALEGPSSREVSYALEVAILDPTPAPVGDSCFAPMPLIAGASELVSLFDKQAEVTSSCETTGPDAVLSLRLDSPSDVLIHVDAEGSLAVAALQRTCGEVASERGCQTGEPLRLRLRNVEAGDYFVVVDSAKAPSVTVRVETFPPTPTTRVEANDTCLTAFDIPVTGGAFSGDTRTLQRDYSAPCGGMAESQDAVFRLVLPDQQRVYAALDSGFDGVLHRMQDERPRADACKPWQPENCSDDPDGGAGTFLDEILNAGTYYYVVDGYRDFNAGYYQFDVTVADP